MGSRTRWLARLGAVVAVLCAGVSSGSSVAQAADYRYIAPADGPVFSSDVTLQWESSDPASADTVVLRPLGGPAQVFPLAAGQRSLTVTLGQGVYSWGVGPDPTGASTDRPRQFSVKAPLGDREGVTLFKAAIDEYNAGNLHARAFSIQCQRVNNVVFRCKGTFLARMGTDGRRAIMGYGKADGYLFRAGGDSTGTPAHRLQFALRDRRCHGPARKCWIQQQQCTVSETFEGRLERVPGIEAADPLGGDCAKLQPAPPYPGRYFVA